MRNRLVLGAAALTAAAVVAIRHVARGPAARPLPSDPGQRDLVLAEAETSADVPPFPR
jgi:hypothetical protein